MPYPVELAASVQFEDSFLAVGGLETRSIDQYYDSILRYDEIVDDWFVMPQKLRVPRALYDVFFVPNEALNCT